MSGDNDWVSVSEAARRIGVTRAAIYSRVTRKTLETMTDNHGHTLVRVSLSGDSKVSGGALRKVSPETLTRARPPESDTTHPHSANSEAVLPVSTAMAMLAEQASLHRSDIDTLHARHDAEIARRLAERDALHQDTLGRLQAQAGLERALWLERIDAAEMRAERVEEKLDMVLDELLAERRSWWSRWLGTSTKSTLRNR